jgi:hypothetical protein
MSYLNTKTFNTNNIAQLGWSSIADGMYQKKCSLSDGFSYVTIKVGPAVTNEFPVIVSSAQVPGPISGPPLFRKVQVTTRPKPKIPLPGAMVVVSTVDFAGAGITTDSFDSGNTNYSTGGTYDPLKARDHGDVCTMSSLTNSIQIGNGKVKGKVRTGINGWASTAKNGSVGDMNWVNSGNSGIEDGHFSDDINFDPDPVILPANTTWLPPVKGNYVVNGATYKFSLDGSAPWIIPNVDGPIYVGKGDAVLYVTDSIKITGGSIRIAQGASLTIYMAGASANFGGQGIVNDTGLASKFTYYGLDSNTQLSFSANVAFVGSVYAPNAFFTLGGGGANTYDFVGQCFVRSAKMNGHYNFHFDEALKKDYAPSGYVVTGWNEL